MSSSSQGIELLVQRVRNGEESAVATLFDHFRDRLRRMVRIRLDRRVQGRVDVSDVLQEAFLDVLRRMHEYAQRADYPFFLWLRQLVGQRLIDIHRQHLGAQMRNAELEVPLFYGLAPSVSTYLLADQLIDRLRDAAQAAEHLELQNTVRAAVDSLHPMDREILAMRHFEMLSNDECAQVLGTSKGTASKRYVRALKRLKKAFEAHPGFPEAFF